MVLAIAVTLAAVSIRLELFAPRHASDGPSQTAGGTSHVLVASSTAVADRTSAPPSQQELYQRAMAAANRGADLEAASTFQAAREAQGALSSLAALRAGQAQLRSGQLLDAAASLAIAADDETLPTSLRLNAASDGLRAGHDAGSAALVRRFVAVIDELIRSGVGDPARADWAAIQALRDLDDPAWITRAAALVGAAPGSAVASDVLDALGRAGIAVPTYTAALVRYRARDDDRATALFREVLRSPASSAESANASFYLGALAERRGDDSAAIDAYGSSLRAAPDGGLAADAHWWRGLLLQYAGSIDAALTDFHVVVDEFPASPFADDAAARAALLEWRTGRSIGTDRLRWVIANRAPTEAAEAARVLALTGLASSQDRSPASLAPFSFAAVRGQGLGLVPVAQLSEWNAAPRIDWAEADRWMGARFREPTSTRPAAALLALTMAADAVGENVPARAAWLAAVFAARRDPYESLRLARTAAERDRPDVALAAATNLVATVSRSDLLDAPRAILQLLWLD